MHHVFPPSFFSFPFFFFFLEREQLLLLSVRAKQMSHGTKKNSTVAYVPCEDLDQPGRPSSLVVTSLSYLRANSKDSD